MKTEIQIALINDEIEIAKAYVSYWTSFATSKANYARKTEIRREGIWREMTDAEKEQDAFDTAMCHIKRIEKLSEKKMKTYII